MRKLITILLVAFITINVNAQKKEKQQPQVDYRIDNMGYWRKMAKQGLVPVQPNVAPPKAKYKGSTINSRGILEDSVDVPTSNTGGEDTQSETSIFVDPNDNAKVLNSNNSTSWTGTTFGVLYGADYLQSQDYGVTWGGSVEGAGGPNNGDPSAVISLSGRQFTGFINSSGGMSVAYSDDGVLWNSVVCGSGSLDKNHLWIDNSLTSPHQGNLYHAWTDFSGGENIYIVRSTDNGLSYSTPMNISAGVNAGNLDQGVNIQTGPNGEVYVIWSIYDSGVLHTDAYGFAKSLDGGVTFSPAVRIINNVKGIRATGVSKNQRAASFPSMSVDISGGDNNGTIYMVWPNFGVPGTNTGTNISVYMAKSSDGGDTWATPVRVNQGSNANGKEAYMSWMTCDPENGILSVVYYDDRDVSATEVETWVSNSYDAGATWEAFRVSDVAFTPQPINGLAGGYMGDYLGISARGGMVYPVWPDNRNGYVQTFVSPYETNNRVKPINLNIALTEATGQTDLTWNFDGATSFQHFIVYRDNVQIGTTTNQFYTDNLPTYGLYQYSVSAMHDDGESSKARNTIQWGNPNVAVNPASLEETLLTNETSVKILTITNTGELDLTYSIKTQITNRNNNGPLAYCDASGGGDEYISGVEFGDIVNTGTGADNYTDNIAISTQVDAGNDYPITITIGNVYSADDIGIWIDWNQDEDFEDAGEEMICEAAIGDVGAYNYTISVPSDALGGQTRMRVRLKWGGSTCGNPCGTTSYGEVEDYGIEVKSWLNTTTTETTITPGNTENINVNFDSTDLALGDYTATITVNSNATDTPVVDVPVTLHVVEDTGLNTTATADQTTICIGSSTTLHANPTGGTQTYTYAWTSVPAGFTSTDQNPQITPTVDTIYSVEVNDGIEIMTSDIAITMIDVPTQPNTPTGVVELCQDDSNIVYTTTAVINADSYEWSINPVSAGVITGSDLNGTVNWDTNFSGTATISVKAINSCGSGDISTTLDVLVNESPNVTFSNIDNLCFDATPMELTQGSPIGGTYTGNGVSGSTFDPVDAGVGIHNITYTYTNEKGCVGYAVQNIEVYPLPTVTLNNFPSVGENVVPFTLEGGSPVGGTYIGNGVINNMFSPATAGVGFHEITYTYIDENGCINSATQTIEVTIALGVNDIANGVNFNLYPNPNKGELNFDINSINFQDFDLKITNQLGITVINKKINVANETNYKINLSKLTTGVYFFTLSNKNVNYTRKIILENK